MILVMIDWNNCDFTKLSYIFHLHCVINVQASKSPRISAKVKSEKGKYQDSEILRYSYRNFCNRADVNVFVYLRPHHSHHGYMHQPVYAETSLSTTSGNWTLSDSASSASRQQVPSVVSSSIPSSASHFLNESTSDIPTESIKSQGSGNSKGNKKEKTIVTYFLGLEPIPYRTSLPGKNITLAQFKTLITKKGTFR